MSFIFEGFLDVENQRQSTIVYAFKSILYADA